ncbi:MAG: hypothetical protein CMB80_21295 [Flammeovirgaceae bacterium]|nr:hypothetical protein [Flammeovirgaceae bacterium]MBR06860.1 hypothetical protein [Rickettsiales bacterium]HCX24145.1 DUF2961 domain-containing protein [Cytophagales bacterium]|tara:strand:- start:861 stop:2090 length:1230 start_codon:yes stop_codon:yes gene_type:complete
MRILLILSVLIIGFSCQPSKTVDLNPPVYSYQDADTRWSSPENINGLKGEGGQLNNGAKGRPSVGLEPGESIDLLNIEATGVIRRMWFTVRDRSPEMLRSLRLDMYWDHSSKPAVSVPFGDFFSVGLGRTIVFQNEYFANPEGRSFNSFIPMPFKSAAKIVLTNESDSLSLNDNSIFFDIDYQLLPNWSDDMLYFHCYWSRDTATTLTEDFELLPQVSGTGRFLGVNVGVNANPLYEDTWWGEGEIKMYEDGDEEWPTLVGTGTEDYIGTAWGQGKFINRYTGCTIANDSMYQWAYYRFHVVDPIYFSEGIKVTHQQMGGAPHWKLNRIQNKGVPLIPVTILTEHLNHVYEPGEVLDLDDQDYPRSWTNFYRSDDYSATAYFYLSKPTNDLPDLQSLAMRLHNLKTSTK